MTYRIEFDKKAAEDFACLDGSVKKQIQKYIDKIASRTDPRTLGEPLEDNLSSYWKYRVGDYRIVAEIQDEKLIILMLVVGHRREIDKIAKKRLN